MKYRAGQMFFALLLLAFSSVARAEMSEEAKIERLIAAVERMPEGTQFIRNGTAHSGAQAAAHLRMKYRQAKRYAATARDFIENLASKSSLSGKEYSIRYTDGTTMSARDFFTGQLEKLER